MLPKPSILEKIRVDLVGLCILEQMNLDRGGIHQMHQTLGTVQVLLVCLDLRIMLQLAQHLLLM